MKKLIFIFVLSNSIQLLLYSQNDSTAASKLTFAGDFRFRIEQDWNSRNNDGTFRDNRSRLRYRLRFGANYQYNEWVGFGARIRTGEPRKQQDPHLTLGDGFKEFSTLPLGLEKLFVDFRVHDFHIWLGKNTFPFKKQNELFWSDNVYPEGLYVSKKFSVKSKLIQSVKIAGGHFIVATNGTNFNNDGYFQGLQIHTQHWNDRLELFPAFYYFNQMPNVPDGFETYNFNYSILQMSASIKLLNQPEVSLGIDYYFNVENLSEIDSIPTNFQDQKTGLVIAISLGKLDKKGDWFFRATYTYLERYSAVDFLAQNDWARWDYSAFGSPDGRLTNFQGLELMAGYALGKNFRLNTRFFKVDQLVPFGAFKENGSRIRLDLDIGF